MLSEPLNTIYSIPMTGSNVINRRRKQYEIANEPEKWRAAPDDKVAASPLLDVGPAGDGTVATGPDLTPLLAVGPGPSLQNRLEGGHAVARDGRKIGSNPTWTNYAHY